MTDRSKAGRKAKRHGRQCELRIWRQLVEEGFRVIIGGSGKTRDDVVDMVAIGRNVVRMISGKNYKLYGREREAELDELNRLPRFPGISRELWEWDSKFRRFKVSHV